MSKEKDSATSAPVAGDSEAPLTDEEKKAAKEKIEKHKGQAAELRARLELEGLETRKDEIRSLLDLVDISIKELEEMGEGVREFRQQLKWLETTLNKIESDIKKERAASEKEKAPSVMNRLDKAVSLVENYLSTLGASQKKDRLSWALSAAKSARAKVDDKGYYLVQDEEGNSQKEGIPVEGLIRALTEMRASLDSEVTALDNMKDRGLVAYFNREESAGKIPEEFRPGKDKKYKSDKDAANAWVESKGKELKEISGIIKTLNGKSEPYFKAHPEMTGDKQHWRTELEAKLISKDQRATGSQDGDYKLAMEEMDHRRELIIPKEPELEPETETLDTDTTGSEKNVSAPEEPVKPEAKSTKIEEAERAKESEAVPPPTAEDITLPNSKLFLVDISEIVKRMAWSEAETKLEEIKKKWKEKNDSKGFWGKVKEFGRRAKDLATTVWVGMSEKQYLSKLYQEALSQMQSDKNLMAEIEARVMRKSKGKRGTDAEETSKLEQHFSALDDIIGQYTAEVAEDHEKGGDLNDEDINTEISNIIYQYAVGEITDRAGVESAVNDRIKTLIDQKKKDGKIFKFSGDEKVNEDAVGLLYASNIFETAKSYQEYIDKKIKEFTNEHGEKNKEAIKNHLFGTLRLDIRLGLKERDLQNTKPKEIRTWTDKLIDKAQQIPVLNKIVGSPTSVGAAVGVVSALMIRREISSTLRKVLTGPAVGAILGGAIGAMRRGRNLQYERAKEQRRGALGREGQGKDAGKIKKFDYDLVKIDEAIVGLKALSASEHELTEADKKVVADLVARLEVERNSGVDLLQAMEEEGKGRGTRIKSMTELKKALRVVLGKINSEEEINELATAREEEILNMLEEKDSEFKKFRRREMAKSAAFGAVVGATAAAAFGYVAGEIVEHFKGDSGESVRGLREYMQSATAGNGAGEHVHANAENIAQGMAESAAPSEAPMPMWNDHRAFTSWRMEKLRELGMARDESGHWQLPFHMRSGDAVQIYNINGELEVRVVRGERILGSTFEMPTDNPPEPAQILGIDSDASTPERNNVWGSLDRLESMYNTPTEPAADTAHIHSHHTVPDTSHSDHTEAPASTGSTPVEQPADAKTFADSGGQEAAENLDDLRREVQTGMQDIQNQTRGTTDWAYDTGRTPARGMAADGSSHAGDYHADAPNAAGSGHTESPIAGGDNSHAAATPEDEAEMQVLMDEEDLPAEEAGAGSGTENRVENARQQRAGEGSAEAAVDTSSQLNNFRIGGRNFEFTRNANGELIGLSVTGETLSQGEMHSALFNTELYGGENTGVGAPAHNRMTAIYDRWQALRYMSENGIGGEERSFVQDQLRLNIENFVDRYGDGRSAQELFEPDVLQEAGMELPAEAGAEIPILDEYTPEQDAALGRLGQAYGRGDANAQIMYARLERAIGTGKPKEISRILRQIERDFGE